MIHKCWGYDCANRASYWMENRCGNPVYYCHIHAEYIRKYKFKGHETLRLIDSKLESML